MSQTLNPVLLCLDPDLGSPRGQAFGPFAGVQTVGIYHNPQPRPGFIPVLKSLSMVVKNTGGTYDVTLAPKWTAAFITPESAPDSPGDKSAIIAGGLIDPRQHAFYTRLGAPAAEAKALNFLNGEGMGYIPPKDEDGRWWGLLARADDLPIGGIVTFSPNWSIVRDPNYVIGVRE